ncbi:MAG: hypothetical protein AUJ49_11865, partial [Desulfovibrionaceae bacterium CG1_02_65_16]
AKFRVDYQCISLGGMSLCYASMPPGMRIHCGPGNTAFLFCLPLFGHIHVHNRMEEYVCHANQQCALLDGSPPSIVTQEDGVRMLLLTGGRMKVEEALSQRTGCAHLPALAFQNPMRRTDPGPDFFCALVGHIVEIFNRDPAMIASPVLAAQYEEMLLTAMLASLPHTCNHLLETLPLPQSVPRVVRLAEAHLEANADRPMLMDELVQVTGMGLRSIQSAFKRFRGYTPSDFLRQCRLNKARQMLRTTQPGTTILSIAFACGFASQSHFCKCYRKQFGERAMDTMRRAT